MIRKPTDRQLAITGLIILLVVLVAVVADAQAANRQQARVTQAVRTEFGNGWLGDCFLRIVARETGHTYDPLASNWRDRHSDGSRGSFGLTQIGALHRRPGETVLAFARRMWDPRQNLRLAHRLYRSSGFSPWGGCP